MTAAVLAPTVWLCPGGFVPRRRVTMHIEDLTDRVKEWSKLTRLEFNRKLEDWYNDEPQTNADGPSLTLGQNNASVDAPAAMRSGWVRAKPELRSSRKAPRAAQSAQVCG